jgi:TonB family protein
MRTPAIIVFTSVLLSAAFARALEANAVDGYGPYRFGMSVAEARAAGPALREREGSGHGLTLLEAPDRVSFGDISFPMHLNFREERLNRIVFEAAGAVRSASQCAMIYDHVLASLEQTYGAFAGAAGPSEYGRPAPPRITARGSQVRTYEHGQEQVIHANRRGSGWIEALAHSGPRPGLPADAMLCKITIDLRDAAPPLLTPLAAPTPQQLAAARPLNPGWAEQPNSDAFETTLPQYMPHGRVEVNVDLDCLVIEEGRLNCAVREERPPNQFFGEFALRLSRSYRAEAMANGQPSLGGRVQVPITVTLTGPGESAGAGGETAGAPAPSAADLEALRALAARAPDRATLDAATLIERAQWIERPTAQSFARHYPGGALERGVSGRVVLECIVAADGRLQCAVIEEDPAGEGFGLAALGIAQDFRMAHEIDGQTTAGKRVRVPIRFNVG